MKVFISWSGPYSKRIAGELYKFFPMILQRLTVYMSAESIEKGARWSANISKELEEAKFGILVMTKENTSSPWIHFEAGALAKSLDESRLAPILFGLKTSDIQSPLSQFQVTQFHKDDFFKLLESINSTLEENALSSDLLKNTFDIFWPKLSEAISPILSEEKTTPEISIKAERDLSEILEEVLTISRHNAQLLSNPDRLIPIDVFSSLEFSLREMKSIRNSFVNPEILSLLFLAWDDFDISYRNWSSLNDNESNDILIDAYQRFKKAIIEVQKSQRHAYIAKRKAKDKGLDLDVDHGSSQMLYHTYLELLSQKDAKG